MIITIEKNNVYDYALALTARAGSASGSYETVAITKDNYPMLDVYLSEALTGAEKVLRKDLAQSNDVNLTVKGEQVTISIKEQRMGDVSVYKLIASSLRLYMAYHIAASWLKPSAATALAETYALTSGSHLQTASDALNQREKAKVAETDYGDRHKDQTNMSSRKNKSADYGIRTEDDVIIRPCTPKIAGELLLLHNADEGIDVAVACDGDILISNP